jgi:hypothetical protein
MPTYVSTDPNFGLDQSSPYVSTDPNFGLEQPTAVADTGDDYASMYGGPSGDELNQMAQGSTPPWAEAPAQAVTELVGGMVPHDLPSYIKSVLGPAATAYDLAHSVAQGDVSGIPLVGRVPEIIEAEKTPAASKERYLTAMKTLMDVGLLAGAGGERTPSPLRPEPTLAERITQPRVEPAPQEPLAPVAPETPPAPEAKPIPKGITVNEARQIYDQAVTESQMTPAQMAQERGMSEAYQTEYPYAAEYSIKHAQEVAAIPFEEHLNKLKASGRLAEEPAPTAGVPEPYAPEAAPPTVTPAERSGQILERRKGILARKAELTARAAGGEQGLEGHLAAVEAELNDPVTNPVVHAPPVEAPVRSGEFAKPGYTAVETPPEGPAQAQQAGDLWYQGVSKEGVTQWVTHDSKIAADYAKRRGPDARVNVYTAEQVGANAFADNEGNLMSPQEYAKNNWSTTIQQQGGPEGPRPKPIRTISIEEAEGQQAPVAETPPEPYTPEAAAARAPQKPSKIGQSIEAKAVEAKLTQGFGETAGYDPLTIKDQAARASGVIESSPQHARAIVRGEAPLPEGLRGTSLITAMEEHLLRNPDAQVAYELANSPLTSATSAAAQEMRLMRERVPDSLTAKFSEIKAAREAGAKLRGETAEKVKADISKEVVRQASKRPTWEAFVREIVC